MSIDYTVSSKMHQMKQCKSIANEITESGAILHELLGKEAQLKQSREKALNFLQTISKDLDTNKEQEYIEKCIKDLVETQKEQLSQMQKMVKNLETDEKNLDAKIKKRGGDLERAEKRMKSLQNVRPAFMDEYEKLETDLETLYNE